MSGSRITIVCLAALALAPGAARAQQAASSDADAVQPRNCFAPSPRPRCRSFWITELGLLQQLTSPPMLHDTIAGFSYPYARGSDSVVVQPPQPYDHQPPRAVFMSWEVGRMVNQGEAHALGGSVFVAVPFQGDASMRYGISGRYRWWSPRTVTVDLAPALFLTRAPRRIADRDDPERRVGVLLRGMARKSDLVGVTAEVELGPGRRSVQAGAQVGSTLGAVSGVALPVLGILAFMMFPED